VYKCNKEKLNVCQCVEIEEMKRKPSETEKHPGKVEGILGEKRIL
jgi:hypothetical protein